MTQHFGEFLTIKEIRRLSASPIIVFFDLSF
jgi:hypothetical protein